MADKQLGIMITKYANLDHIAGVVKAAGQAGHPVRIFVTDEGIKFTRDAKFLELLDLDDVEVAACDHMCEVLGIKEKVAGITYGSQYDNAGMLHDSERVLVF
jgi:peroxiredoxin family protein